MELKYDSFNMVENETVYLCRPLGRIISVLQGIETSSFKRVKHINNTSEISFEVNKYVDENGVTIENPLYDKILKGMELFINNVGYFVINSAPETIEDKIAKKSIEAVSIDSELQNNSISILVNYGTEDSLECLVKDSSGKLINVDPITNKPLRFIKLYDSENPELSLLDIVIEKSKCNWTIGHVPTLISGLELKIQTENQDVYSFLTQDIAKAARCIFEFDCCNRIINVHSIDEIGYDTGIYISFRNLLKSLNIKPTTEKFYTRYNVKGNDINIDDVNFGNSWIEDLSYFMNVRDNDNKLIFVSEDLRSRYYGWKNYVDTELRPYFIEKNEKLLELKNKLYLLEYGTPNDYCGEDWTQYTDEDLVAIKSAFQEKYDNVQLKYKEKYHKETVIESEIKETEYWFDFFCFRSIIDSINNEQLYRASIVDVWSGRKGDVNGDGEVDDTDAELVAKFLKGQIKLKDSQIERADWNEDGIVDNNDLKSIKEFIKMSAKESRNSIDYQTEWSLYGYEELKMIKEDYLAKLEDLNNLGVICYTEESDGSIKAISKMDAHALSYNDLAIFLDPDDGYAPNGETFTLNTPTASVRASSHGYMVFENIQNGTFELWKNSVGDRAIYYDIEYKILDFIVDDKNQTSSIVLSQDAISNGCYIEEYVNPITSIQSKYVHIKLRAKQISNVVGDTNGDGIVDTYDLILAEEMMNGETDFDMSYDSSTGKYGSYQLKRADVNGDGRITQEDLDSIEAIVNNNLENGPLVENSEKAKRYILYVNQINRQMKLLNEKISTLNAQIEPLQKHVDRIIEYSRKDFVNDYESSENYVPTEDLTEPPNDYYFSNTYGINRYFTNIDLKILSLLNYDTEYINESLNVDNYSSITDFENDLRTDAAYNLAVVSQPQLSFSANLSNLLAIEEFKCMHADLNVGNFIRLEYNDGFYSKLRIIKISYNSLEIQNDSMEIEFSNMLRTNVSCNDFASLLDNVISGSSIGGSSTVDNLNSGMTEEQVRAIIKAYIDDSDLYSSLGNQYANKNSILKHLFDGIADGSLRLNTAAEETTDSIMGSNSINLSRYGVIKNSPNSVSLGDYQYIEDSEHAHAYGHDNKIIKGSRSTILGNDNEIGDEDKCYADQNNILGSDNKIEYGNRNTLLGNYNSIYKYIPRNMISSLFHYDLLDIYTTSPSSSYDNSVLGYLNELYHANKSHVYGYGNKITDVNDVYVMGWCNSLYRGIYNTVIGALNNVQSGFGSNTIGFSNIDCCTMYNTIVNSFNKAYNTRNNFLGGESSEIWLGYSNFLFGQNSHMYNSGQSAILGSYIQIGESEDININEIINAKFINMPNLFNVAENTPIRLFDKDDQLVFSTMALETVTSSQQLIIPYYENVDISNTTYLKFWTEDKYYISYIDRFVYFKPVINNRDYSKSYLYYLNDEFIYDSSNLGYYKYPTKTPIPVHCKCFSRGVYNSTGVGNGLKIKNSHQTVVGEYNNPETDAVFVVGNGTSDDNRSNAFEVLRDGTVVLKKFKVNDDIDIDSIAIPKSYTINLELEDNPETAARIGYNFITLTSYRKGVDNLCVNIDDDIYIPLTVCDGNTYIFSYYDVDEIKWKSYKIDVDFSRETYTKTYIENSGGGSGSFNIENLSVEKNGLYTPPTNTYYNNINVNVPNTEGSDTMSLYGQNYDINAIDLIIPSSIEYVKDELYDMRTIYRTLYGSNWSRAEEYDDSQRNFVDGTEKLGNKLRHITFSEGVKQIGHRAFRGQTMLDRIDFPSTLEWIHGEAFEGSDWLDKKPLGMVFCDKVLYLYKGQTSEGDYYYTLSNFYKDSIKYAIEKEITIPQDTISISTFAFYNIRGIQNVNFYVGEQDYDLIGIGDYTFYNCKYTDSIATNFSNLPNSITWIGKGAFEGSGASFASLPIKLDHIRESTFKECDFSNVDLNIPNAVKAIDREAFRSASVNTINFGNSVEFIGEYAFQNNNLTSLTIPNSVKTIERYAFDNNTSLTTVSLPNSITSIGGYGQIFRNCSQLLNVTVEEGFKANYLDLSASTRYSQGVLEAIIDNLADKTGLLSSYLIVGSNNLAKISSTKIALAASKNWTIA